MGKPTDAKAERVLSIYSRLLQGKVIYKEEESLKYDVAQRTIQRDIADIQCFLQDQSNERAEIQTITFDRKTGGYRLETKIKNDLEPEELLSVCKILLESRALVKDEMFPVIYKLLGRYDEEEQHFVKECIRNELYHYVELNHHKKLLNNIWVLERSIKEKRYLEIRYRKMKDREEVIRKIKPVGVMFSEFYFYLTAYIDDIDKEKAFQNPDDPFPTIYRIDRLEEVRVLQEHFSVPYRDRFEEGEFRKRIQFMYGGKLRKIRFRYTGKSVDFILDRLPTAQIVQEDEKGVVIQAEVFGDGVDMWMRSQGDIVNI